MQLIKNSFENSFCPITKSAFFLIRSFENILNSIKKKWFGYRQIKKMLLSKFQKFAIDAIVLNLIRSGLKSINNFNSWMMLNKHVLLVRWHVIKIFIFMHRWWTNSKLNSFLIRFDLMSLRLVMPIRRFKICGFDKIVVTFFPFPISQRFPSFLGFQFLDFFWRPLRNLKAQRGRELFNFKFPKGQNLWERSTKL